MINWLEIGGFALVGVFLGLLYFGGLWWTVSRLQDTDNPVVFYLTSLLVRTSSTLFCLFLILQVGIVPTLAALLGMVCARLVLVRHLGLARRPSIKPTVNSGAG